MNNKNLLGLLASLLPITIVIGCKGEKASAAECVKDSVVSLSIDNDSVIKKKDVPLVVDSIGKSYSSDKGTVDFAYSFPVSGPHVLVDSIRAYLSSEMKGAADSFGEENSKTKPFPRLTDGKAMINYYAKIACENVIRTFDDVDYPDSKCPPELSMFVLKGNETSRYITYVSSFYLYSGGAHGMYSEYAVNFDKKTGVILRDILNPKDIKALQPILRSGLESFFRKFDVVDGEKDVEGCIKADMDNLFIENGIIPLPKSGVYLSPEGLVFIYGQYEIGAYAIGTPTFTVPYNKIEKFLSPEAQRLAGIK